MDRKHCADCGQSSLTTEPRCWACGGSQFSGDASQIVGDRTINLGEAREMTMAWTPPRTATRQAPLYIAAGTACALFTCMVGYWIGRASMPAPDAGQGPSYAVQVQPLSLPTPPTGLSMPPPVASTGIAPPTVSAAPAVYDPAVVTIRPKPGQAAPAPQRLVQAPPTTPHPSVYQNPAVQRQTSQAVVQSFPTVPDAAFSAASAPVPQPSATSAIVMVRNTAAMPVELSIDGPEQLTAVVAPGSALPVNLPPGTYQLRASGDGIRSRRSTLALAANRSYALIIDRRQDSGRDSLVLIEPAVDGQGG